MSNKYEWAPGHTIQISTTKSLRIFVSYISASLGRSEASSAFRSSTVSGSASESHSRSAGVGLGGGVQRTPFGEVRQWSKSRTRRSVDETRESQGGATTGSGSTTCRN
jgi:hypothetical protein